MMCPDCGDLRHKGECDVVDAYCGECGDHILIGKRAKRICHECQSFYADREFDRAMSIIEAHNGNA